MTGVYMCVHGTGCMYAWVVVCQVTCALTVTHVLAHCGRVCAQQGCVYGESPAHTHLPLLRFPGPKTTEAVPSSRL